MRQFWRIIYPILIYVVLSALVLLVTGQRDPVFQALAGALAAIPVLGYLFLKEQRQRERAMPAGRLNVRMMGAIALFGASACLAVNNLISISHLAQLFPGFDQVSELLYEPPLGLQILAIGIVIPIAEELVFRGLVFARLRNFVDFGSAALLSSLLFGLYHGNVVQLVYAFVLGLAMCWVYERTGSLAAPILFHQTANLCSVVLTAVLEEYEEIGGGISFYIITLVSAALALGMIRAIKKNRSKEELV